MKMMVVDMIIEETGGQDQLGSTIEGLGLVRMANEVGVRRVCMSSRESSREFPRPDRKTRNQSRRGFRVVQVFW